MAKPFHFSRWRRVTMQAVMCGVLAGSVAVAALVDSHLHHLQQLLLGSRIVDGPVSFYLPSGWKISATNDGAGSIHKAVEDNDQRAVAVIRQQIDQMMSPLQYLYLCGRLEGMEEQDGQRKTVMIDNWPGQLLTVGNRRTGLVRMIACVILPTREAITLEMEEPGPLDPADAGLFNLLVKGIQINGISRPTSGVVQFPGVTLTLPGNFQLMPETDPLYTQRHIFSETPEEKYVTAELIPVFLPDESPAESMLQILAGQESNGGVLEAINWFNAKVSHEAPDRWRIDLPDSPNHRAYLLGKSGSQGMLISMHTTDANSDSDLDAAWSDLSPGIHFKQATDIKTLITAGAELARAFPPRASIGRYFLYSRKGVAEGFIEDSADSSDILIRQIYLRNWNTSVTRINQSWGIQPAMWARAVRSDASQATNGVFVPLIDSTMIVNDAINSTIKFRGLTPSIEQLPLPPNFVVSVRLPDILAKAPAGDSAIWTDRFVGDEGDFLLRPILLTVHRAGGFVEVQINGSGQLSRWHFDRNGALEHADFPGGLTLRPATETEISAAFPDGRLTPTH